MRSDGSGLHRVPTGDLNGVGNPDWGSAPRDSGGGATAAATGSRPLSQAGSAAVAARRCAPGPEPHPPDPAARGPVSTSAPAGNAHGPPRPAGGAPGRGLTAAPVPVR
jgi:hypothetical protein